MPTSLGSEIRNGVWEITIKKGISYTVSTATSWKNGHFLYRMANDHIEEGWHSPK